MLVRRQLRRQERARAEVAAAVVGRLLHRVVASVGAEAEGRLRLVVVERGGCCLVVEVVELAHGLCREPAEAVEQAREKAVVAALNPRVSYSLRMVVVRQICCRSLLVLLIEPAPVAAVEERHLTVLGFWLESVVLWLRVRTCLHLRVEVVL